VSVSVSSCDEFYGSQSLTDEKVLLLIDNVSESIRKEGTETERVH